MSAVALWLAQQGYQVSGSDMTDNSRTQRLREAGVTVYHGHDPRYVGDADQVVYNSDVPEDNPERLEAVRRGIPLRHRSDVLAMALSGHRTITVSGSHGKTTTTTMIGCVLEDAGWDPTVFVGGEVARFRGNVRFGHSPWAVAEADESDGTFLRYQPEIAVATNIEPEHLDHYGNRFDRLVSAFEQYLSRVGPGGLAVLGVDSPALLALAQRLPVPVVTYGQSADAMVRVDKVEASEDKTTGRVWIRGRDAGRIGLEVPGVHNLVNALAAVAVADYLGIERDLVYRSLARFRHALRRFQVWCERPVRVIDDYAHHPTEIRATLAACRQVTRGRVIALFQPQRYVRTKNLWDAFVQAFDQAEVVVITDIYSPPGEPFVPGVSGERLADAIRRMHAGQVWFVPELANAPDFLNALLQPGDTLITMGAGPVYQVAQAVAQRWCDGARGQAK